jgi:hypothetical protein
MAAAPSRPAPPAATGASMDGACTWQGRGWCADRRAGGGKRGEGGGNAWRRWTAALATVLPRGKKRWWLGGGKKKRVGPKFCRGSRGPLGMEVERGNSEEYVKWRSI